MWTIAQLIDSFECIQPQICWAFRLAASWASAPNRSRWGEQHFSYCGQQSACQISTSPCPLLGKVSNQHVNHQPHHELTLGEGAKSVNLEEKILHTISTLDLLKVSITNCMKPLCLFSEHFWTILTPLSLKMSTKKQIKTENLFFSDEVSIN